MAIKIIKKLVFTFEITLIAWLLFGISACGGAKQVKVEDPAEALLEGAPQIENPPSIGACNNPRRDPGPSFARRMTRWEYVNTVNELLNIDITEEAKQTPDELFSAGFYNTALNLIPSYKHIEAYNELADVAVQRMGNFYHLVGSYTSCEEFTDTCENAFVASFGEELFRRKLKPIEIEHFRKLFDEVAECSLNFNQGAKAVVKAMLQSPQFLYRLEKQAEEKNNFRKLDSFEIASRLSYMVTSSPPDFVLMHAANEGELDTAKQREEHVRRLFRSDKALQTTKRFVNDWMRLDEIDGDKRDSERFPLWTDELRADLKEEVMKQIEFQLWENKSPLKKLFDSETTFLTPRLANLYGLDSKGEGWHEYDLSTVPNRKGLLTMGGVLARNAGNEDVSLVTRALFVFRNLMCLDVEDPPANLNTSRPAALLNASKRQFADYRITSPVCKGCHEQFDPLSLVFEPYDSIGEFHEMDNLGNETRSDGHFPKSGERYSTIKDFSEQLMKSEDLDSCMIKKPLQFFLGRELEESDNCLVEDLQRSLAETDGSFQELIVAIVRHPTFIYVRTNQYGESKNLSRSLIP